MTIDASGRPRALLARSSGHDRPGHFRFARTVGPSVVAALMALNGAKAPAQEPMGEQSYRLQPGDALHISVFGIERLDVTSAVRTDGRLSVPLIGEVEAGGLTFDEVRRAIVSGLDQQAFRFRTFSGDDATTVIDGAEVFVDIASYRAIFVDGDVRLSGEQAYSPGLTVRQALARAGGVDITTALGADPFLSVLEFAAQRERVADRLERLQIEIDRVRAELAGAAAADDAGAPAGAGPAGAAEAAVAATETGLIAHDADSLDRVAQLLAERVEILEREVAARKQAEKLDRENEEEVRSRLDRGVTQIVRLTDARRATVDSLARLRSTEAALLEARRGIVEVQRQAERLDKERRVELTRDFRRLLAEIAQSEIDLRAANARLSYAGGLSRNLLELRGLPYEVNLVRTGPEGAQTMPAPLDMRVAPGDVVELRVQRMSD